MLRQHITDYKVPYKTLASGIKFVCVIAKNQNGGELKGGSYVATSKAMNLGKQSQPLTKAVTAPIGEILFLIRVPTTDSIITLLTNHTLTIPAMLMADDYN
jgi:hypothetical protein